MSGPPNKRRRTHAIGPDSAVFAKASTHKSITTTDRSGNVKEKRILVPLVPIKQHHDASSSDQRSKDINVPEPHDYEGNTDPSFLDNMDGDYGHRVKSKVCTCFELVLRKYN
jgi:hypothetical protein